MAELSLDSHKLQYHPDRVADFLAGRTVWPLYAEISPTSACNHRCRFCNFSHLGHSGAVLPQGRMLSLMDEMAGAGVRAVVLAGAGEPSLHPDAFPALRRGRDSGMDVAMSTNGALLREWQIAEMAELLTWTRFSINGGEPGAYAAVQGTAPADLELALRSVAALAERKQKSGSAVTIGAQCVLVPENKDSIERLAQRLRECGADYLSVKHFYASDDNAYQPDMSFLTQDFLDGLRQLAARLSDHRFSLIVRDPDKTERRRPYRRCHGLPFIAYVREDGALYTCFSHQVDAETVCGNLLEHDFSTIWRSAGSARAIAHVNGHYDKNCCQANCRHHQINLWLHQLKNPPAHVNFI